MRKIKNGEYFHESLPLKLFREDLQKIENFLVQDLSAESVEIRVGKYEYDSLEEIAEDHEMVSGIELTSRNPYLDIDIRNLGYSIHTTESSLPVEAISTRVKSLLKDKQKVTAFYIRIFIWISYLIAFIAVNVFSWKFFSSENPLTRPEAIVLLVMALFGFGGWILGLFIPIKSEILFCAKSAKPNFFQRKKDELILVLTSFILGAIATALIT